MSTWTSLGYHIQISIRLLASALTSEVCPSSWGRSMIWTCKIWSEWKKKSGHLGQPISQMKVCWIKFRCSWRMREVICDAKQCQQRWMDRLDTRNQSLDRPKKRGETYLSRTLNRQMMELTNNPPHRCWLNHLKYWKISGSLKHSNMFTSSNFQGLKRCFSIVFCRFCFMFRFVYLAQVQVRILEVNSPKGLRLTGRGGPWHRSVPRGDGDRADGMMQELLGWLEKGWKWGWGRGNQEDLIVTVWSFYSNIILGDMIFVVIVLVGLIYIHK